VRKAIAVTLVAVVVVAAWALFIRDDPSDPVAFDCGPTELEATPEVEPEDAPPTVDLQPLVADIDAVAMAERTDGRLLVLTRSGTLLQVDPISGASSTLVDLQAAGGNERGGLGMAIAPDGAHLYLSYTPDESRAVLEEFPLTTSGVDVAGRRILTEESNLGGRHLLANLVFGPDGLLYVGVGDAGTSAEEAGEYNPTAQDLSARKGKIWRIDPAASGTDAYTIPPDNPFVGEEGAAPETYLVGFRNPWRFSFDRATGDLWIADAGEYCAEEVDHLVADQIAGANLGWGVYEGVLRFSDDAEAADVVAPIHTYGRALADERAGLPARCAVIGGYVYRGAAIPELGGRYVFGDYCSGQAFVLDELEGGVAVQVLADLPGEALVQSFGEGRDGELFVLTTDGVFRLAPG
jgi:glucose/arabinose dehydrogenase